jgi:hypothetical protein
VDEYWRRREREAELLVSVEANDGGVGSLRDAKEFIGRIDDRRWTRRERRRKWLILIRKCGGGAGICTYSVAVSIVRENARVSGQTADGTNVRRLHRYLRTPLECPEIHRIRGGIVEATGARSRRRRLEG